MSARKLGTFLGVYTPTVLTILGVIMYLRAGWLVGHLGLFQMLLVVVLANSITIITALSFSSVATNERVGGGGAYYIVSRSLGLEIGGSIGLPLFLSQAFSVTLYAFGLAESLRFVWPELPIETAAFAIVVAVAALAQVGARQALQAQVLLMVLVAVSLVALAIGTFHPPPSFDLPPATGEISFWTGFAVFFPAVTGVMAGLGLSGDLEDPGRAIPLGSILAVLTGFAVYLTIPVLLVLGSDDPATLRADPLVWTRIAVLGPWLVLPGLWAAIFSSAVGSMLGAPRTLQALARDGLAPRVLAGEQGGWSELLPGLAVSLAIALGAVFLGDLNAVAAVVSMFFLTVYGVTNLVAAIEALSGDPSWRPTIQVPWPVNVLGAFACVAVMFLINPVAAGIAILAELVIATLIARRAQQVRWGDARRGLYESLVRWALVRLARRPMSARSWRPHVLVFASGVARELELVRFGNWFSQGRGVVTVCELVVGDLMHDDLDLKGRRAGMQAALAEQELTVFAEVDVVADLTNGLVAIAQSNGMAGFTSNTILLGWPTDAELQVRFLRATRSLERLNKSVVLARTSPAATTGPGRVRRIHVWWGGMQRNGDLMLLLAYLLKRNRAWRDAEVVVLSAASSEMAKLQTERYLASLIPQIRIDAATRVIIKPREQSVADLIHEESADADVVFLGLGSPDPGRETEYAGRLDTLADGLATVFFVKNASVFIGELLESTEPAVDASAPPPRP